MGKPFQITSNVYQVGGSEITDPADAAIYLIDAGGELLLVDSGAGGSIAEIPGNVRALGLDPALISHVIATHGHIDHIGGLQWLKQQGIKLVAHATDAVAIEDGVGTAAEFYGVSYLPVTIDLPLSGSGAKLRFGDLEIEAIHIPGHTPGSLALLLESDGQRVLFGQDIHGPYMENFGASIPDAIESLRKLRDLSADILCEGHFASSGRRTRCGTTLGAISGSWRAGAKDAARRLTH